MQTQIHIYGNDSRGAQLRGQMSLITNESLVIIPRSLECDTFI